MSVAPFDETLRRHSHWPLTRETVTTVQINVGKLCNQACHHCHVDAGPKRTEIMTAATAARALELLGKADGVATLDLTGGAPELNPSFRDLVAGAARLGKEVIVRCNLTVLFEPGMVDLPGFYREHDVHLICSLPCYTADNVDRQRGRGVFGKSIAALQRLGAVGYGRGQARLDLVYNPLGAFLPPPQAELEAKYREELDRLFGIRFDRLLTITNLPVKRFAEMLARSGEDERYMSLLVAHFNAATVPELMCRSMVSVAWDGALHDCDFHQMEGIPLATEGRAHTLWTIDSFAGLGGGSIATALHCYGCTAGAGSSCGGSLSADSATAIDGNARDRSVSTSEKASNTRRAVAE
ncbi:MAG: arsenosugar biosynthesis radical SAM (seleno)protein ArsS [Candidatus Binatia bacterium]